MLSQFDLTEGRRYNLVADFIYGRIFYYLCKKIVRITFEMRTIWCVYDFVMFVIFFVFIFHNNHQTVGYLLIIPHFDCFSFVMEGTYTHTHTDALFILFFVSNVVGVVKN